MPNYFDCDKDIFEVMMQVAFNFACKIESVTKSENYCSMKLVDKSGRTHDISVFTEAKEEDDETV